MSKNIFKNGKNALAICIILTFILSLGGCAGNGSTSGSKPDADIAELASEVLRESPEAEVGVIHGEWAVMGLKRSKVKIPNDYFDIYYDNVRVYVKSKKGKLAEDNYTEYARLILALSTIGKDPRKVEGYDLAAPLEDFDKVIGQGINGASYALIAANEAGIDLKAENKYLQYILNSELKSGGFGLSEESDAAVTSMVIQALSYYKEEKGITEVIDRSFDAVSSMQNEDGSFVGGSETVSQVILALCALDRDVLTDEQFTKNGKSLYEVLIHYKDGAKLVHELGEAPNAMATEQGLYALSAMIKG